MNMHPTIAVSFARRQTPTSHFSHFEGTEEALLALTLSAMEKAIPVNEARTILRVPVAPEGFWSAVRPLQPGDVLKTVFEPRRPGEDHVQVTVCKGQKAPAQTVEIILYHRDALGAEATSGTEWEVISINATPYAKPLPMDPVTMARNQLQKTGGTFQRTYTPEEWAESVWFWTSHANVEPG